MRKVEKLAEKVKKEFELFKKEELKKTPKEIFEDSYIIRFFEEVNRYFETLLCTGLNDDIIDSFLTIDNLLWFLYEEYLSSEFFSIDNWEELEDSLNNIYWWKE